MLALIERADDRSARRWSSLGLNHEQQHQELILTDIKHALWSQPAAAGVPRAAGGTEFRGTRCRSARRQVVRWQEFEGGIHQIGHAGGGFAFDNEGPRHEVLAAAVRAGVACGHQRRVPGVHRRRRLPQAGAVAVRRLGRRLRAAAGEAPLYWEHRDGEWWQFTLNGMRPRRCRASRSVTSATTRPTPTRAGPARGCRPEEEWEVAAERARVAEPAGG